MKKTNALFTNIDRSVKVLAKVLFYVFLIAGIVLLIWGLISVLGINGGDTWRERSGAYIFLGAGAGAIVASFMALPLYGLGELISVSREIRTDLKKTDKVADKPEEKG